MFDVYLTEEMNNEEEIYSSPKLQIFSTPNNTNN
jgi:hypothetical protein